MSAATEYRRALGEIQKIAERIPSVLNEHMKRQEASPEYWTWSADLRKARLDLLRVLAFLNDVESREQLHAEGESR